MEPKGPLPHSQVPTTSPYLEPARSSPCPTSHYLKIHLNIILPSMPGFSKWSLFLRFPCQKLVYASTLPHMWHTPHPSHSSWFNHQTVLGEQYRSLSSSLCSFSNPCYLVPLSSTYSPQHTQPTFCPHQHQHTLCNPIQYCLACWNLSIPLNVKMSSKNVLRYSSGIIVFKKKFPQQPFDALPTNTAWWLKALNHSTQRCAFHRATYKDIGMALNVNCLIVLIPLWTFEISTQLCSI